MILPLLLFLFSAIDMEGLTTLIESSADLSVEKKIEAVSLSLMNTPYKDSSIGEGEGIDKDPVINLEYIDCMTFVEYVIAFVNSRTIQDFERHIIHLRYRDNSIKFEDRMHLPDFQWFPNALNKGYLKDITALIGEGYVKRLTKGLYTDFYIKGNRIDHSKLITDVVEIDYIPVKDIEKVFVKIPEYSVIRILRKDSFRPYVTTHMGIVIKRGSKKYLRHSSRHFGGRVTDTSLYSYFKTFEQYENWEALGIAIYKINDITKGE